MIKDIFIEDKEQVKLFNEWWATTFEKIHPNWRNKELGRSTYFHCKQTWLACAKINKRD